MVLFNKIVQGRILSADIDRLDTMSEAEWVPIMETYLRACCNLTGYTFVKIVSYNEDVVNKQRYPSLHKRTTPYFVRYEVMK